MAKARILAVDDQRYFRELIAGMLSEEGYEAQTASSGEEALHILDHADFDVVLTDLVMPGMDGSELVQRVKERKPDQDVVVVTGVVDVKTAVDAMKLGATEYLLKPFDRRTLAVVLEGILQGQRLEREHARLLAENIEYIGERTLYERALSLFSTLSIEPLAMRIVDALCQETRAQGGVIWVAADPAQGEPGTLDLAAARGLVRLADEPELITLDELPEGLAHLEGRCVLGEWPEGPGSGALFGALRSEGHVVGVVRLSDKLEGESFDAVDRSCADKLLRFADVALGNALRVRALERRSLRDAQTGAFRFEYLENVLRNEIEKAGRFGRQLALVSFDPGAESADRRARVAARLRGLLRASDVLAVDEAGRFTVLLPEADAVGAATLRRRALQVLAAEPLLAAEPEPATATAIYPVDGVQAEALLGQLETRLSRPREGSLAERLAGRPVADALRGLVEHGVTGRPETVEQIVRFVLAELGRSPRERGLLLAVPGGDLAGALRDGLEALREVSIDTDLVVVASGERPAHAVPAVSWVDPRVAPDLPPCLIHFGGGPAYALVSGPVREGRELRFFHSDDRALVEHLAFGLRDALGLSPPAAAAEARP